MGEPIQRPQIKKDIRVTSRPRIHTNLMSFQYMWLYTCMFKKNHQLKYVSNFSVRGPR